MHTYERRERERPPNRTRPASAFGLAMLILAVLVAGYLFLTSTYFAVGSVVISGTKYLPDDDVYRAAGIPPQINIFRLSPTDIKHRLLQDLRVADVEVTRQFPATIAIRITERKPLAYIASSYGFIQVDGRGVVLAAVKNIKQFNVPLITGVRLSSLYVGDEVEAPQVRQGLEYLAALDEATLNQLSEVNISSAGVFTAYTIQPIVIRLGGGERMAEKAKLTREILLEIGGKKTAVDYIDLNYASPYIKFRP